MNEHEHEHEYKHEDKNNSRGTSFIKKSCDAICKFYAKALSKISRLLSKTKDVEHADYYETGKQIVPELIEPDEGEITLKQYDLAILRTRAKLAKAKGKLQVTNKRLLFRAAGRSPAGATVYQQEFAIDKIDGVEVKKDFRFRGLDLLLCLWINSTLISIGFGLGSLINSGLGIFLGIISLLIGLSTCIPFFTMQKRYFIKLLLSGIGSGISITSLAVGMSEESIFLMILAVLVTIIILVVYAASVFMFCLKPNLRIEIKSGGTPAMQIRHKYTSLLIWHKMDEYSGFAEVLPDKDADLAIKELGAIINDVKTLGDLGVEKWKQ